MERNEGSIWNSGYDPNEDPEIMHLRGLAVEHVPGRPAELSDEQWMLLLDNDAATLYRLRDDDIEYEPYAINPHGVKFPGERDMPELDIEEYTKTDWLRLLKWDVGIFNQKIEQWREQRPDAGRGVDRHLHLSNGYLANAFLADASLSEVELIQAAMHGANLTEADLSGSLLMMAHLHGATLTRANLFGASLRSTDMSGADLIEADLRNVDLMDADMTYALLMRAKLSGTMLARGKFANASLIEADLAAADMTEIDLTNASLRKAHLQGANLVNAVLVSADISEIEIDGNTKFNPVSLRKAKCSDLQLANLNLTHCEDAVDVDLNGCKLQKVYFRSAILGDTMVREKAYEWGLMKKRGHESGRPTKLYELETSDDDSYLELLGARDESALKFAPLATVVYRAGDTYLNLKTNWQDIGYYDDASWASIREKECERKMAYALILAENNGELDDKARATFNHNRPVSRWRLLWSNLWKWIGYSVFNSLCQYGENPLRLAYWYVGLIVIFALLYPISGVNAMIDNPGSDGFASRDVINYTSGSTLSDTVMNAGRFMYYSMITFTTVGYGDYYPVGALSHFLAMLEAFLGVFLIGLFIWCLGRRVGAR